MLTGLQTNCLQYYSYDNLKVQKMELAMVDNILLHKYHYSTEKITKLLKLSAQTISSLKELTNVALNKYTNDKCFKNDVNLNIHWFTKHQHPVYINNLNTNYIIGLLSMPITTSKIANICSVPQPLISYLRNFKRHISSLSLKTADKLIHGYKEIRNWTTPMSIVSELCPKLYINTSFDNPYKDTAKILLKAMLHENSQLNYQRYKKEYHNNHDIYLMGCNPNNNFFSSLICISYVKPNVIYNYTPQTSPEFFVHACQKLASVPIKNRHWNDAQYMRLNLMHKKMQIIQLSYGNIGMKTICHKLNCNSYLVKLVLSSKI